MLNLTAAAGATRTGPRASWRVRTVLLATALALPGGTSAVTLNLNNVLTVRTTFDQTPGHPYDVVVNGPLTLGINPPRVLVYAGGLRDGANPLSLDLVGGGTLVLTGSGLNTYSGETRISSGNHVVAGAANVFSPNSIVRNGLVDLAGFDQSVRGLTSAGTIGNSAAARATLTIRTIAGQSTGYSGAITGTIAVVKSGPGTQTFDRANAYDGGTTIIGGTLGYGDRGALGTGPIVLAGGTLAAQATNIVLGNAIVLASDGTYARGGYDTRLGGPISGTHALTLTGNGGVTLAGANTYTGGTVLSGGRTVVGSDTAFGTGTVTVRAGATLGMVGGSGGIAGGAPGTTTTLANRFDLATTLRVELPARGETLTLNGTLGGVGGVGGVWLRSGDGVLRLGGDNRQTGTTQLDSGTLAITSSTALGTGYLATGAGTTLRIDAAGLALANKLALAGGQDFRIDTNGFDVTLNGPVRDLQTTAPGGFVKTGAGTLVLSRPNSYAGGTRIEAGAVSVAGDAALGRAGGGLTFAGTGPRGGELIVTGTAFGGTARTITLEGTGGAFTIADAAAVFTVGTIGGTGELGKRGAGTLVLGVASSYSGGTFLAGGTLRIDAAGALGAGVLTIDGGTLLGGIDGLALANTVAILPGGARIDTDGFALTLAGVVAGPGALTKVGSGTLTLGRSDGSTGAVLVGEGTLAVSGNRALGTGTLAFARGTTLRASTDATLVNATTIEPDAGGALPGLAIETQGFFLTLAGPVGGGGLVKTGGGTLRLDGANAYTGGTRVDAGTVVAGTDTAFGFGRVTLAAGTTLGSGAGGLTLANALTVDGSVIDTHGVDLRLTGVIAGTSLLKNGSGALILSGANEYSAGTSVAAGTLVAASDGAFGSGDVTLATRTTLASGAAGLTLGNAVTLAGAGAVDTAGFDLTLAGTVGGPGALTKTGAGTLTLAGANGFAGGTTIAGGTLTGSVASLGGGGIVDDAALVIAEPTDASFATAIAGTGTLTKTGAGTLTLTGASPLTGATTIAAGRLGVTGSLSSSIVTVASGASLVGTGSVGGLVAGAGALVAPGTTAAATATLTVAGNAAFAAGAILAVDVSPATADLLRVGGAATLGGTLAIAPTGGRYAFNSVYTLVAAATLTGTFAPPVLMGMFGPAFAPELVYGGTTLTLRLRPNSIVALATGLTLTPNQRARAAAFDGAVAAGYDPQGVFALFNQGAALPAALDQLTGEIHSASRRAAIEDLRHVREAALDRLGAALAGFGRRDAATSVGTAEHRYTLWGRVVGARGRADRTADTSGFDHDTIGTIIAFDIGAGGFTAGALAHYTRSDVDYAVLGEAHVASTGVGVYGGYRGDRGVAVGFGGTIATVDFAASRAVTTPGYAQRLRSDSGGESRQAFAEIAFDLAATGATRIEPFARVATVGLRADALRETGGIVALHAPHQSYAVSFATLGLRGAVETGDVALRGSAGWQRTGGDRAPAALLALDGTDNAASIAAAPLDRDALAAQVDGEVRFGRLAALAIGYSGIVGKDTRDHAGRATLTIGF